MNVLWWWTLRKLRYSNSWEVRDRAEQKLIAAKAIQPAMKALEDPDTRSSAMRALKNMGPQVVEPLSIILKHSDQSIAESAAEVLGEIGAVNVLVEALQQGNPKSISGLAKLETEELKEIPSLSDLLLKNLWENPQAATILGVLQESRAVEPLLSLIKIKSDRRAIRSGAEALGRIGDLKAVETLIEVMQKVLDDLRSARFSPVLVNDSQQSLDVVGAIAEALGKMPDARSLEPLNSARTQLEHLKDAIRYDTFRSIARALDKIVDAEKSIGRNTVSSGLHHQPIKSESTNPVCPGCGTIYNRKECIRQSREKSPQMFDFAVWTIKFRCVKCGEILVLTGKRGE